MILSKSEIINETLDTAPEAADLRVPAKSIVLYCHVAVTIRTCIPIHTVSNVKAFGIGERPMFIIRL